MGFLDQIVGSFSTGAADNPTVAMMDAAFAAEGRSWRYVNCEVEAADLGDAVAGARAMGWQGFNCSMPHKQTVIPLLDSLSPSAELCQAVNCITRTAGGWAGHNTDGAGFVASCREVTELVGIEVLVIGSGGAASAIAVELALAGAATIHLAGRNPTTTSALAALLASGTQAEPNVLGWSQPLAIPAGVGLVVNATPVGMTPDTEAAIVIDWSSIESGAATDLVVGDVVFNPAETTFLRAAAGAGIITVDGTGMLVNQAAENIHLWTGSRPDRAPMRAALEAALGLA